MIYFAASVRQCLSRVAPRELEKDFATQNFDGTASNADVNYPVIVLRCADKNTAGPLHLDALFDEHSLVGSGDAVGDSKLAEVYNGKVYHFCCDDCPAKFKSNPDKYANAVAANPAKYGVK